MEDFAEPFPTAVIAEVLGVDRGKREDFQRWSKALSQVFNPKPTPEQLERLKWGSENFQGYLKQIFDERDVLPQTKLLVLAPLGLRGGSNSDLDASFSGWVTKPVRASQFAQTLIATWHCRNITTAR